MKRLLAVTAAVVTSAGAMFLSVDSLRTERRIAALEARVQTLVPAEFNGKPIRVPCFVSDARLPGVVYPLGYLMHCDPDRWIPEAP